VALALLVRVGRDVVVWNWRVLLGTLARGENAPRGGFVTVPLDLRDPTGLAALAAIMCVIPGTIWSELALDRSALLVHMFHIDDAPAEVALIKQRYERPLMEIFE
jgi:multicomponent K+:H+ antiporter subunit E